MFGIWNSQQVVQVQVMNLMNSFLQNGLDQFNAAHMIPLVIDKQWMKKDSYTTGSPMDLNIEQIPLLEIDETIATKNWSIPAAGGQHCMCALKAWHEKKKTQLNELELLIKQLKKQDMEEATEEDIGELNKYIKEMDGIKGLLGYGGQWLVMIYSKEALVLGHKWYNIPHAGVNAGPIGKQMELLSQDYVFKLMLFMNSASMHYIHSLIFDLNKLHAMMMSPGGGIIAYVMSTLKEKLALCFNTVKFTIAEFTDLDKKASKCAVSSEKEQAHDHLQSILDTLRRALPLHQAIVPQVWDVIDAVFTGHLFADSETVEEITQIDEDISLYEDDVKKAIQMSPAKISLLLSEWCSDEPLYLFPLPSYRLIKAMNNHLLRINGALLECASWWLLFIHHDKVHPQDWSPGSASADMVRAVLAHRSPKMDGCVSAINEIVAMIFLQYATFLQMEDSLTYKGLFHHQLTQNKLLLIFCQLKQDNDKDSHPKGKGKAKVKAEDNEGDEDGGQEDRQVGDDGDDDKGSGRDMSEACDGGEPENADGKITREQWVDRRAHAKEEAAAHHQLLAKEAETAIMYLSAVEKPLKITPKDFGIPTDHLSKLPSHAPKNIFHGQEFIIHHTYKWANQLPNSKK
ncbi:hypothetical protein F5J12DRAFT_895514 [Pisolithus orientalis]|uniref:uncharacterized protein n=1 Tax=Pisolithus orientalis TaxID=936130 RepID=UPI002223FDD6|nr:uncharacterized protein F5J12DRAFT_895514 [Pisolithus orientalis]KAI5998561.1 hypothetical protein F5J12DRAFT_895514 [Pisolithus orientalis]